MPAARHSQNRLDALASGIGCVEGGWAASIKRWPRGACIANMSEPDFRGVKIASG
jgi:hypothetical protein